MYQVCCSKVWIVKHFLFSKLKPRGNGWPLVHCQRTSLHIGRLYPLHGKISSSSHDCAQSYLKIMKISGLRNMQTAQTPGWRKRRKKNFWLWLTLNGSKITQLGYHFQPGFASNCLPCSTLLWLNLILGNNYQIDCFKLKAQKNICCFFTFCQILRCLILFKVQTMFLAKYLENITKTTGITRLQK